MPAATAPRLRSCSGGHVVLYVGGEEVINAGHTGVLVHRQDLPRAEQVVSYVHLTDV